MTNKQMTPAQAREKFKAFEAALGPDAWVSVSLNWSLFEPDEEPLKVSVYPSGVKDFAFAVMAPSFDQLFERLSEKWEQHKVKHDAEMIRKIALEIIKITADRGECTPAALRQASFSKRDIERYGKAACADADEIAGKGPFTIVPEKAGANAPPEGVS